MKHKILDLFCGAGGLSLGFKNADFEIFGGVEWDEKAMETHTKNFQTSYHFSGDISKINNNTIKHKLNTVDGIIGGPPCQGFSSANRYLKDEDDPRNALFFEYLRFVEIIKPKFFVIENVPGILSRDNGFAKNKILEITESYGYNVSVQVLSSEKYGVPEIRKRAFFIGIRKDLQTHFDFGNLKPIFKNTTVKDAIEDLMQIENEQNFNTLFGLNRSPIQEYYFNPNSLQIENHDIPSHNEKVVERIKYVPQGGNWRDVPENLWDTQRNNRHSSAYKRLDFSKPSITIDTGHMNYFHPVFHRVPTVRESARIQSFNDNFIFYGSKTQQYRQVGNAVPPILAEVIAREINSILNAI
ncbi:DNA cytosine methyltransferase [Staphylococcus epidermidis]|uniref:DNA cytosine methyltransferase n=1 Tax=Staphylococcus epidermidis TaxID=1282 RepID=UPI00066A4603|nr:DNA cytosine methyltransferase [Staphylococcus epidermidis]KAB2174511.1 DNA cytosine methyltransferase [Staphylococcus epidermidis]MCG1532933.1 DNA cytosine methyltransferase [Staphylococcus epidermidis]MCG1758909.1 DNA cytosine methyltransferase [Staphylococcus epidermidis]MCG1804069.1 DNA cytosine methyltransferase [Staphylococcus epidermidis]MCG1839318.1 DNA cytosine methyltransferase [Staphylococcus epidermidis]